MGTQRQPQMLAETQQGQAIVAESGSKLAELPKRLGGMRPPGERALVPQTSALTRLRHTPRR